MGFISLDQSPMIHFMCYVQVLIKLRVPYEPLAMEYENISHGD